MSQPSPLDNQDRIGGASRESAANNPADGGGKAGFEILSRSGPQPTEERRSRGRFDLVKQIKCRHGVDS